MQKGRNDRDEMMTKNKNRKKHKNYKHGNIESFTKRHKKHRLWGRRILSCSLFVVMLEVMCSWCG